MEKILKKYTTIPQNLYVNRDADEQLKRIVEDMQRPGYVLVARQMGKTNLLFNAKRTLENSNRLFVYVDLSNVFDSEVECYRNIVDTILEPNEEIFQSLNKKIKNIRELNYPPHKEYSKCLSTILQSFEGDIIIVLDEIDALRTTDYSDHIFAQIRSSYFSRTNFPVFNRLTYVLSGVIEPSDLIKDRNKSPFNIGDKIYLNDFTIDEHFSFIKNSQLSISNEIANEIFEWAHGNPRLTFDICSEIEDQIAMNKKVTKELISEIINKKYLTNYDIAPVDHIRELVKSNSTIRNAVYEIQLGHDNLDDEIKRILYLYGIIGSNFKNRTVIKNRIIREALSIQWIDSINKQSKVTVTYGLAQIENKEFNEAIQTFTKLLETTLTPNETEVCNYFLGFANYSLRYFEKAISYFSFEFSDNDYKRKALSLLGICKLGAGVDGGIEILENLILEETYDFAYHNALLNLAINLPKSEGDRALALLEKLFESTFKARETKEDDLKELRTLSLYYQYEIYIEKQDNTKALEKIKSARTYANNSNSLYLIYLEYILTESKNEELKSELINKIIDNNLLFDNTNTYPISFSKSHIYRYLAFVFDQTNLQLFDKILAYAYKNLFDGHKNQNEIIYYASQTDEVKKIDILKYILVSKNEKDSSLLLKIHRELSLSFYIVNPSEYSISFNKYLDDIKISDQVLPIDIYVFALAIKDYSDNGKINEGINLCEIINNKIQQLEDEELNYESLIIYYWFATLYFSKKDFQNSLIYSKKTLEIINKSKRSKTSMIDEKGLKSISEQMFQIKSSITSRTPIVKGKKYGRNEIVKVKYKNEEVKQAKYKYLEADILAERCEII